MANGKTKKKNYKNVEILWPRNTWGKIVGGPLCDGEKAKKGGEYTGSTPAFFVTHHATCVHTIRQQRDVRVRKLIT